MQGLGKGVVARRRVVQPACFTALAPGMPIITDPFEGGGACQLSAARTGRAACRPQHRQVKSQAHHRGPGPFTLRFISFLAGLNQSAATDALVPTRIRTPLVSRSSSRAHEVFTPPPCLCPPSWTTHLDLRREQQLWDRQNAMYERMLQQWDAERQVQRGLAHSNGP